MFEKIKQLKLVLLQSFRESITSRDRRDNKDKFINHGIKQISFNLDNFTCNEIEHRVANNYLNRNALFNVALFDYMRKCIELDVQLG